MDLQGELRQKMREEYKQRSERNPRYSWRSFALFLGVDSSLIRKFLRGERQLGLKTILIIMKKINLDPTLISHVSNAFSVNIQNSDAASRGGIRFEVTLAVDSSQMPRLEFEIHKFKNKMQKMAGKTKNPDLNYDLQVSFTPAKGD